MSPRRFAARMLLAAVWLGAAAQALAQADPTTLRAIVAAGEHPSLKSPKFPDYRETMARFYEPGAYAPAWIRGVQPTRQAGQALDLLRAADIHGLEPKDYDA